MATQAISRSSAIRSANAFGVVQEQSTLEAAWARFVDNNVFAFSYSPPRSSTFSVQARACSVTGFTVARLITTGGPAKLDRRMVDIHRDNKEAYAFYVPTRGYQDVQQFHRNHRIEAGSLTIVSTAEPFLQLKPGNNDTVCLLMPADFVDQRVLHVDDLCARVIPAQHGLARLFCQSMLALEQEAASLNESQFLCAVQKIGELALLAVTTSESESTDCRPLAGAYLANAKRVIRHRLTDPDLTPSDIARECHVSLRYLHKLFKQSGRSLMEYVVAERLQCAMRMLENPSRSATVTDVCFASGFSNASQFSTAFRKAFSVSPRDVLHGRGTPPAKQPFAKTPAEN